jgi:hypothetical protein
MFLSTYVHYICFHKYIPILHFINWNEIISFKIFLLGYILTYYAKNIVKLFSKFKVGIYTNMHTPRK